MIVIVILDKSQGKFSAIGPFVEWEYAVNRARDMEIANPRTECYPVKLYKRNKYGAPEYPFHLDDTGDD